MLNTQSNFQGDGQEVPCMK